MTQPQPCARPSAELLEMQRWRETGALQDLDPANVRSGSFSSDRDATGPCGLSALLRKLTNGGQSQQVRFVPIAT